MTFIENSEGKFYGKTNQYLSMPTTLTASDFNSNSKFFYVEINPLKDTYELEINLPIAVYDLKFKISIGQFTQNNLWVDELYKEFIGVYSDYEITSDFALSYSDLVYNYSDNVSFNFNVVRLEIYLEV